MFLAVKEPIKDIGTRAGHLGASLLLGMLFGLKLYVNYLKLLSFDSGVNDKKYLDLNPRQFVKLWLKLKYAPRQQLPGYVTMIE